MPLLIGAICKVARPLGDVDSPVVVMSVLEASVSDGVDLVHPAKQLITVTSMAPIIGDRSRGDKFDNGSLLFSQSRLGT